MTDEISKKPPEKIKARGAIEVFKSITDAEIGDLNKAIKEGDKDSIRESMDDLTKSLHPDGLTAVLLLANVPGAAPIELNTWDGQPKDDIPWEMARDTLAGLYEAPEGSNNYSERIKDVASIYPELKLPEAFFKREAFGFENTNHPYGYSNPYSLNHLEVYCRVQGRQLADKIAKDPKSGKNLKALAQDISNARQPGILALLRKEMIDDDQAAVLQRAYRIVENFVGGSRSGEFYQRHIEFLRHFTLLPERIRKLERVRELGGPEIITENMLRMIEIRPMNRMANAIIHMQDSPEFLELMISNEGVDCMKIRSFDYLDLKNIFTYAPQLLNPNLYSVRASVLDHASYMISEPENLQFMNQLAGLYGQQAVELVKGYKECVKAGFSTPEDREIMLELLQSFRALGPELLGEFKLAKKQGTGELFLSELKEIGDKLINPEKITAADREKPFFQNLLHHVYPNNAGEYGSYLTYEDCEDRKQDLKDLKIEPRYDIDLLSVGEISLAEGKDLDNGIVESLKGPILDFERRVDELDQNEEALQAELSKQVDFHLAQIKDSELLEGINLENLNLENKLCILALDNLYGARAVSDETIKFLLINYMFTKVEDVKAYVQGTTDRVSMAKNQDYSLLCELDEFYGDKLKEATRRVIENSTNNPEVLKVIQGHFAKLSKTASEVKDKDLMARLQVNKLGESDSFIRQISGVLNKRTGKSYTPDEIKRLLHLYEVLTGGLEDESSTSTNPLTKAVYGQLRTQRERTFRAVKEITGKELDPKEIHLGQLDLQALLETERDIEEGNLNPDQFAAYSIQKIFNMFSQERSKIEEELSKFVSTSGNERVVIHGFITKSKESALARMTGGICIAEDNPTEYNRKSIWNMRNYSQLVLYDPEDRRCQGLVLMHSFQEGEKKILSISLNPSNTILYRVDEKAMFNGLMGVLEKFAIDNGFDSIVVPQERTIRSNRTGGKFEEAIDERVKQVGQPLVFKTARRFSYKPEYKVRSMDVLWENSQK